MRRLKLSHAAVEDLTDIVHDTAMRWNVAQARKYESAMDKAFRLLCRFPRAGHRNNNLTSTYRLYNAGSHVIVYRFDQEFVYVVRILHQRMDFSEHVN